MATDIIARGMAANVKKSVTALGNKIESEKWIGTKAEWEAVDKSTIKDGTIVYITDDETVILYDKVEMEKIAAQVAEDRAAAEIAAQTAQSIADSLPDDYTTAVGKIAENTAEISAVKLTDKELQRRVNALYDMGNGITHKFETDTDTAYVKTVPTGAKLMSVKSVGGRSIVWNQLVQPTSNEITGAGVKFTFSNDGIITLNGTATTTGNAASVQPVKNQKGHKYLMVANPLSGVYGKDQLQFSSQSYGQDSTGHGTIITNESSNEKWYYTLYVYKDVTYDNVKLQPQIFDLTAMFGIGNEPTSVEEFEAMFPADYYPYKAGEIVSAGTEEIVEQGKNLWDEIWEEGSIVGSTGLDASDSTAIRSKNYIPIIPNSTYIFVYAGSTEFRNVKVRFYDRSKNYIGYNNNTGSGDTYPNKSFITPLNAFYVRFTLPPAYGNVYKNDIALIAGSSGDYSPFHQTGYPIPEAIRNLPGYGWSAGTARNYIDYENKKYYQCVQSVDLGTLNWTAGGGGGSQTVFIALSWKIYGQKLSYNPAIASNILCSKYLAKSQNEVWSDAAPVGIATNATIDGYVYVNDTAYTDVATFKQAMSGVMLYYELETPIVTDISTLIPADFLRNIEVEAGGSVTFKNSNDSYRIPVPNEEEYIVKLSEVGGTT